MLKSLETMGLSPLPILTPWQALYILLANTYADPQARCLRLRFLKLRFSNLPSRLEIGDRPGSAGGLVVRLPTHYHRGRSPD